MEREEVIEKFAEFLNEFYKQDLAQAINEGKKSIFIDFSSLDRFDMELSDYLSENPEEAISLAEEATKQLDVGMTEAKIRVRFFNLPESKEIRIRKVRAEHIGKMIVVEGFVRRASEIRPEASEVIFKCLECGAQITVVQTEISIRPPTICDNCDNTKGFRMVGQKLYDARWIVIEEPFEITTGERPSQLKVYLKEDLTSPRMQNKTEPGNRIKIVGVLKELPRRFKGTTSRQMEIFLDANNIESVEIEWEELEITPEDEQKILDFAKDPEIYNKLVLSVAPALWGMEDIKEAIALQLFGGELKTLKDKSKIRGDIHILLIGDPSCLVGDERVILGNGATVKIGSLGSSHLEKIHVPVYLAEGYKRGLATIFHKFENQPIIEIITESGKSIKGTFNHPLLTKKGWKRLDEMEVGDKVRTIAWIPCSIHKYVKTNWQLDPERQRGKKVNIPEIVNEKLASILGYLLADGYVQKYRVGCTFNYNELDLIPKMQTFFKEVFGVIPRFDYHKEKSGTNVEMVFNYRGLADILKFIKIKRMPDIIMCSKNSVVAAFLSWLYDGDGSVIAGGRGKNGILYKAKDIELLRDIQILLLRFGIHSRIYGNNLMIRQADSILKFMKFISFNSAKKKKKLVELKDKLKKLPRKRHKKYWEKIVKIIHHPPEIVYDIEVPKYHKFVANGIVSHNTAKSALMKVVSGLIPRGRYVSGKGVTGAGLTAAVVKDEELMGGWVLEAGALVLCNRSLLCIDEFEKIEKTDQIALHEAMEQNTISIAKASIVATLPAQTAILGGGNPKLGRFDSYMPIKEQIDLPETILSRFDLKFALKDIPNPERDLKIADHILKMRYFEEEESKPVIDGDLLKKYVSYARKHCHPKFSKESAEVIKNFYLELRSKSGEDSAIAITPRQYEALFRLAEASAKVQLRNEVLVDDALRAVNLMKKSLRDFGFEPTTGLFDIDRAEGQRTTAAQRGRIKIIEEIIKNLTAELGKEIPQEEVLKRAREQAVENPEEIMNKMMREGWVIFPRPGFIQKI